MHQENLLPVKTIKKYKNWFTYLYNPDKPKESKYRCRLCYTYYDKFKLPSRTKNALAYEAGVLKQSKDRNRDMINDHAVLGAHQAIIQTLQKQKEAALENDFEKINQMEEEKNDDILKITSRMIRTVFIETKTNIPFDAHEDIVLLQQHNGIDMGLHHYSRTGAIEMMEVISSVMHKSLIDHLLSKNIPISIIIDGTTDSNAKHTLIVYFQAIEDSSPVVYFYKLIETTSDGTAQGLYKSLSEAIQDEERDLYNYVKRNLVGYASDGEPVMASADNGLIAIIRRDMAENPIYAIHCMAHRLHLAIRRSINAFPFFTEFEDFLNSLYTFYARSAKRKTHLRYSSERTHQDMYTLNYIYEVRWIASELKAIKNIKNMWSLLVYDLEKIAEDVQFDDETRRRASTLREKLIGRNRLAIFYFVIDVLEHLTFWSEQMQSRYGTLIDFAGFSDKIITTIQNLNQKDGNHLRTFLKNSVCTLNGVDRKCDDMNNFQQATTVKVKGVTLLEDFRIYQVPFLQNIREEFLDEMVDEINRYFPNGQLIDFDIFVPNNIPANEGLVATYGRDEVEHFCTYFKWHDCHALLKDWADLLVDIIKSPEFCQFHTTETIGISFWAHYLKSSSVTWTDKTRLLIQTILVLPIGSAEAERGFSVMNHIQSSRRSRLTNNHLNDLMRIRINAPDKLEEFVPSKYAKEWIKRHWRTDDPRRKRPKTSSVLENENRNKKYIPKSTLF